MPLILFPIPFRWIIRIFLLLFWGATIPLQITGIAPMLEWLWTEHVFWWTGLTVFTVLMFEPRRKKRQVLMLEPKGEKEGLPV